MIRIDYNTNIYKEIKFYYYNDISLSYYVRSDGWFRDESKIPDKRYSIYDKEKVHKRLYSRDMINHNSSIVFAKDVI